MPETDNFNDLLPGKFYGTDDVRNGPVQAVIAGYETGSLKNGDDVEKAGFLLFEGTDRRLIVKPHTVEALKDMFPTKSASIGQTVEMFLDPDVKFGGKKVGGLRLRKPTVAGSKTPF